MWFATITGVTRFDGVNYTAFTAANRKNNLSLLGSDVYDMVADESDNLWALTAYGGLNKINIPTCSVIESIPITDKNKRNLFLKRLSLNNDHIFIGTNEGLLIRFNKRTNKIELEKNIEEVIGSSPPVDDIFIDEKNRVWFFLSGYGILITDTAFNKKRLITASELLQNGKTNLQFKGHTFYNDNLILATTEGIKVIAVNDVVLIEASKLFSFIPVEIMHNEVSAISVKGNTLLLSGVNGLYALDMEKNKYQEIIPSKNYEDRAWLKGNYCLCQTEQDIWAGGAGTEGTGIVWIKNINSPFHAFCNSMNNNGIKLVNCYTLCGLDDSTLITCAGNGLYKINHITGAITKYKTSDFYILAFCDPYHRIVACGYNGSTIFDKDNNPVNLSSVYPELTPLKHDTLMVYQKMGDSLFFFSGVSQRGMYIWNVKRKTLEIKSTSSETAPLKSNAIKCLYIDSKNHLWIICENAISIYNPFNKTIQNINVSISGGINMDVCELQHRFWIACYGIGIIELSDSYKIRNIYTEKEGISSSGVFKIFPLNDSALIFSSIKGLSVLNIYTKMVNTYYEEDGLQSDDFDMLSGMLTKDFIFLGGVGVTKIDLKKIKTNNTPPVFYFTRIKTDIKTGATDTTDLQIKKLVIPTDWLQTNISFVGVNYLSPKRVTYAYRIKENGSNWIDLGRQNFVTLIGLSPGTYTLEVKAANEDGVWCEPKTLSLTFLPKWYQTAWFNAAVILFAGSLFYSFYRYRISQLKKQQQIRREIASDLHDDLGATLNSVKIFTHLAETSPQQPEYLEQIKESVNYAYNRLRDMIWVLDDTGDTVDDLLKRIKQFAQPVANANNIEVHYSSDGSDNFILNKTEKRNLLLIAKETINNCIKYANCKNIYVSITRTEGKLKLIMKDDGKGFNEQEIIQGHGLKNIQERAKQIHCVASIYSEKGAGTAIIVTRK